MRYRRLGRTDIEVSVVCQGCWSLVSRDSTWGGNDRRESIGTIQASLEAGVNFFDTAEIYGKGESEELLAEALGPRRKEVIVASKVSAEHLKAGAVEAACEGSLARLKTDYIDLYQIHWPSPTVPICETLACLEQLREKGKIRAIGVSNFGAGYMKELLAVGVAQSNQLCYNLLMRSVEYEVQPLCLENQMSILCYSPVCQGLLTGKFMSVEDVPAGRVQTRLFSKDHPGCRHGEAGCEAQAFEAIELIRGICESIGEPMAVVAMAWLLAQPGVASVVVGGRNAAQARQNAGAGELELGTELVASLSAVTEEVKQCMGRNCDPWNSDSRLERPEPRQGN